MNYHWAYQTSFGIVIKGISDTVTSVAGTYAFFVNQSELYFRFQIYHHLKFTDNLLTLRVYYNIIIKTSRLYLQQKVKK